MYTISKITSHTTVDFAAEELKKYLRMMMPRCGEIPVSYAPDAQDGFRLGLMADFGLDTSDAQDVLLDDIIYLETDENGGIIAGSNPGALLIAVYRYLRAQGCRWLFPGVDGEYIPVVSGLTPVNYRKLADHRYRGQCNEGAEYQQDMIETIDFTPKIGMNTYMLEFDNPFGYYDRYYTHESSSCRAPEPVTEETTLQWKRQCEAEIQKRGLHFHDMGHGWTALPFDLAGMTSSENISPDIVRHLAEVGGKRAIYSSANYTNVCMSNPETRKIIADYVADYAETQNNVDFLHIWLADSRNNHCECAECRKKTVPDWYVMLLNDIDAELTRRNLDTHLVFIVYNDTFWAPLEERLHNKKRFTMLYAPISRKYTETYGEEHKPEKLTPFNLNKNVIPSGMGECLAYLDEWQKVWDGDCFCYEYHFWVHQCYDVGGMFFSRLLHDDITALKQNRLSGIVEDGSQRSFFPTGFPFYVYGETLYDSSVSFEELKKDYFSHAFGKDWEKAAEYLETLSRQFDVRILPKQEKGDPDALARVKDTVAAFAPVIEANKNQPVRAQTVAWRLLETHKNYAVGLTEAVILREQGDAAGAKARFEELLKEYSEKEIYIERYFDFGLMAEILSRQFN